MITKRTDELTTGDVVRVSCAGEFRTVGTIEPSGFIGMNGEPIVYVMYADDSRSGWGPGNSQVPSGTWEVCDHQGDTILIAEDRAGCFTCGKEFAA